MKDIFGNSFRLSVERWNHIIARHPEIKQGKEIQQTLIQPDIIIKSRSDPAVWVYQRGINGYYITVIAHIKSNLLSPLLSQIELKSVKHYGEKTT